MVISITKLALGKILVRYKEINLDDLVLLLIYFTQWSGYKEIF